LRLRWTALAERDLEDIFEYIAQDHPAAGSRVVLEIIEQVETILPARPASGRPGRVMGTRELVIGSLPYVLPYRVVEDELQVLRVLHTSRRWPSDI
jgi:toxin ParE1/3/4